MYLHVPYHVQPKYLDIYYTTFLTNFASPFSSGDL